uniref:RNA helicase n=1 Tax=Parastrongyloides trichosuri TaxID=131310 RepID=A0A0N4ZIA5_PARTI
MFDPYHKDWILLWKSDFYKIMSQERGYIAHLLDNVQKLDEYNLFAKAKIRHFNDFQSCFYVWAERFFPQYFTISIDRLKKNNPESMFFLYGISKDMMEHISNIFKKCKEIPGESTALRILINCLDCRRVKSYYEKVEAGNDYKKMLKFLDKILKEFGHNKQELNSEFLKYFFVYEYIAKKDPNVIWNDFLLMLFSFEGEYEILARTLDPIRSSKIVQDKLEGEKKLQDLIYNFDPAKCGNIEMIEFRPQDDYASYFKNSCATYLDMRNSYSLRDYQQELVVHARKGTNCIIMAPTGSGKTLCAVDIMLGHMSRRANEGENFRCVFIAPTGPLVAQQLNVILKYVGHAHTVTSLTKNSNDEKPVKNFLAHDVIVLTPQLFLNKLIAPKEEDRIYFSDLSLIVFDECHHCNSNHPYKQIMDLFRKIKNDFPKPQIVGLTASIGSGGKTSLEGCYQYYLEMAVNLNAERICVVSKTIESLKQIMNRPIDKVEEVEVKQIEIDGYLEEALTNIKNDLINADTSGGIEAHFEDHPLKNIARPEFLGKLSKLATYRTFVSNQRLSEYIDNVVKTLTHIYLIKEVAQLLPIKCVRMYCEEYKRNINMHMNSSVSKKILIRHIDELKEKILNAIKDKSNHIPQFSPIIPRLLLIIKSQLEENDKSRIIIFAPTRFIAVSLTFALMEVEEVRKLNMRPGYVISNASSKTFKQKSDEQKRVLESFRTGIINIICCTTIAEEGLDIDACNLVIKYNINGNEKTLIQRRGRARAHNAKSILLTCNSSHIEAEITNFQKELLMEDISKIFSTKSSKNMLKEIEDKREKMKEHEEFLFREKMMRRKNLLGKTYDICCNNCRGIFSHTTHVRKLGNHVILIDNNLFQHVHIDSSRFEKPGIFGNAVGDIYCAKCFKEDGRDINKKAKLGEIIYIEEHFYVKFILRNAAFKAKISENEYHQRTTWDAVENTLFIVERVSIDEVNAYNNVFEVANNEPYKKCCELSSVMCSKKINNRIWDIRELEELEKLQNIVD